MAIPEEKIRTIGMWSRKHQQYFREHYLILYNDLILRGKLTVTLLTSTLKHEQNSIGL